MVSSCINMCQHVSACVSMYHQCINNVSTVYQQCINNVSTVYQHQPYTGVCNNMTDSCESTVVPALKAHVVRDFYPQRIGPPRGFALWPLGTSVSRSLPPRLSCFSFLLPLAGAHPWLCSCFYPVDLDFDPLSYYHYPCCHICGTTGGSSSPSAIGGLQDCLSQEPGTSEIRDLVSAVERLTLAVSRSAQRETPAADPQPVASASSQGSWDLVDSTPPPATSAAAEASFEELLSGISYGDYNSFAARFPECPVELVESCRALPGGKYSREYRAKRAWEAGLWTRLCLDNKLAKPRASLPIDLSPSVYIVVRAPGLVSPTRVHNASDLYRITGLLGESSSTLCHGFPSQAEARIYCKAIGLAYPDIKRWS